MSIERKILQWSQGDDTGVSSECMAMTSIGMKSKYNWTPADPSDLNRCLKLIKEIPEIKESFNKISNINKYWKSIIDNWDLLEKTFIEEVGFDWCKSRRAPITYDLMKDLERKVRESEKD